MELLPSEELQKNEGEPLYIYRGTPLTYTKQYLSCQALGIHVYETIHQVPGIPGNCTQFAPRGQPTRTAMNIRILYTIRIKMLPVRSKQKITLDTRYIQVLQRPPQQQQQHHHAEQRQPAADASSFICLQASLIYDRNSTKKLRAFLDE